MPDTIASYNTFIADTLAKSSEVNTNFSNHRGNLIPINESSEAAANNAFSLGNADYRWSNNFSVFLTLGLTTGSWEVADSAPTTGASLEFFIAGATAVAFDEIGIHRRYLYHPTTAASANTGSNLITTTGYQTLASQDIRLSHTSSVICSWQNTGTSFPGGATLEIPSDINTLTVQLLRAGSIIQTLHYAGGQSSSAHFVAGTWTFLDLNVAPGTYFYQVRATCQTTSSSFTYNNHHLALLEIT